MTEATLSKKNRAVSVQRYRSEVYGLIRKFFQDRKVLEVETPVLSSWSSLDPNIDVFKTRYERNLGNFHTLYLQTSPEMYMKRLLCRGYPSIFQIGKSFRNGEKGKRHNPEFSMLEWYRLEMSYSDLATEATDLIEAALGRAKRTSITYADLFLEILGFDPFKITIPQMLEFLRVNETPPSFSDRDDLLIYIMSQYIEPKLPTETICTVTDYPITQGALAQRHPDKPECACRFEIFYQGSELCNGYQELRDPAEYERRFNAFNTHRAAEGKSPLPFDRDLLTDLKNGLPECSGVAMGLDRLLMIGTGSDDIADVIEFPLRF